MARLAAVHCCICWRQYSRTTGGRAHRASTNRSNAATPGPLLVEGGSPTVAGGPTVAAQLLVEGGSQSKYGGVEG